MFRIAGRSQYLSQYIGDHPLPEKKEHQTDSAELRSRAEKRLGESSVTASPSGSVEDQLKLLHELQVHRIELEMQNSELRQARSEMETVLEKYTDLYDFAPVGYVTLDRNGDIRAANLTSSSLLGIERSRLIGKRFGHLVSNRARSVFADFLEKVFTSRAKETCEVALLKQGNSELFVQIDGYAVESGEECRIALIDISERKRAMEALRLAKEVAEVLRLANETAEELRLTNETAETLRLTNEAAEALRLAQEAAEVLRQAKEAATELRLTKESAEAAARTKDLFFTNMSHELRTPMAGILGMLQIAIREDLAPAPREYVETALNSARSLLHILNDILDMAKFEAGALHFEEQPFSLQGCLTEAIDIVSIEVHRKGIDFAFSVADEIPETMIGDHMRLRQILLNLIGNAVKFTEVGKVELRATSGGINSDGKRELTFAVTDTGIGIPDDKKKLLFQTFSQVDASHSRVYGGTGLGLAICREIVEQMGGTISFESEEGVGSTFSFTVPLGEAGLESDAPDAAESPSHETMTVPEGEGIPHLLLAEDDPNNRKALGLLLQWANFRIDFAENGLQAVEMWEQGEYELVLMDIQMPHMNGFEATRTIREKERERGGHTPIVAMTAHAFKEDEERCLAGGMDYYISKPIDINKCVRLIRQIIGPKPCGVNH
jgi:PAS domain S-box-containing protein